jgi:hypothetical protein
MSQAETAFSNEIRLALGKTDRHARLFRNVSGEFWGGKLLNFSNGVATLACAQKVSTGLHTGAGDLIGLTTITVTPDLVGKRIAVFTSGEVKLKGGRIEAGQPEWCDFVNAAGGRAGFLYSIEDARKLVALP